MTNPAPRFPPVGAIVTFTCAADSLALAVPAPVNSLRDPHAITVAGTVVAVKRMDHHQPGNIPNAAVTIKGRTGKTVTIDGVACHLRVWDSWAEAIAACKPR